MKTDILYVLKREGLYIRKGGFNELVALDRAWLINGRDKADYLIEKYYQDCTVVPIKLEELEE